MDKMVKTNLRWTGGKSRMMNILDQYLPCSITKYLETFTGGGSVMLYIMQRFNPTESYCNDINPKLINYYQTIQKEPQQVIDECLEIKNKYSAEEFRDVFKTIDTSTAAGFFTANKCSFSGMNSNYSIQAYRGNFSVNAINKISDVSKVIKNVNFVNSDFKCLDEALDIHDFFIYLDPPYYGNRNVGLYGEKGKLHKEFDHEGMFEWVEQHKSDNRIMISYDDSPYIRELYKDYNIYNFGFTYCMTNTGGNNCKTGQEIVITNYDICRQSEPALF